MAVRKLDIKNAMLERARALGNTGRGLKEVCSDLINAQGTDGKTFERIAQGCFLTAPTVKRLALLTDTDNGDPYRPNVDTVERVLRYFGAEMSFSQVHIRREYQNAPKRHDDDG